MPIDELGIGFSRSTRHKTTLFFFFYYFLFCPYFLGGWVSSCFPNVRLCYLLFIRPARTREDIARHEFLRGRYIYKYIPAADAAARSGVVKIKRLRVASRRRWQKENPRNKSLRPRSPQRLRDRKEKKERKRGNLMVLDRRRPKGIRPIKVYILLFFLFPSSYTGAFSTWGSGSSAEFNRVSSVSWLKEQGIQVDSINVGSLLITLCYYAGGVRGLSVQLTLK
jgi:hypothetical protein